MMARFNTLRSAQIAAIVGAGLVLVACAGFERATGAAKAPPDEFVILTKAPLIIPPDYNLRPPQPGAPDRNQLAPAEQARSLLFTQNPEAAAAALGPEYSEGERALLGRSGAVNADPSIRQAVSTAIGQEDRGDEFAQQILYPEQETQPAVEDLQLRGTAQ